MSVGVIASHTTTSVVDVLIDNFNRSDSTTIGAPQTGNTPTEFVGDWQVSTNQLLAPATGESVIMWDLGAAVTNYSYECTFSNISADPGPIVRATNGTNYCLVQLNSGGTSGIYKRVGGGYTLISSTASISWTNGDLVRVDVTDADIKAYRNGTLVLTATDTTFNTATGVGFRTNGGALRFDNVHAWYTLPTLPAHTSGTAPVLYSGYTHQEQQRTNPRTVTVTLAPVGVLAVAYGAIQDSDVAAATGWTKLIGYNNSGNWTGVWWKWYAQSDFQTTLSFASPTLGSWWGSAGLLLYYGVDATTPFDGVTPVGTSNLTSGTITTNTNNAKVVYIFSGMDGSGGANIDITPDAALTNYTPNELNGVTHAAFVVADENKATAGLTTARTSTITRGAMLQTIVFALKPA